MRLSVSVVLAVGDSRFPLFHKANLLCSMSDDDGCHAVPAISTAIGDGPCDVADILVILQQLVLFIRLGPSDLPTL